MSARGIGLFGGSFDPVHDAHLELARRAIKQLPLREVWFVPAWRPPHKPDQVLSSGAHRLAMLERAIEGSKRLAICTIELEQEEISYSVKTVDALVHTHLTERFHLLMGEDSLNGTSTWREPRRLLEMAPPVVMSRPVDLQRIGAYGRGGRRPEALLGVEIRWLEGPPLEISSTEIREALARGEEPKGMAPSVLEYVKEHGLYRPGESS